MFQKLKIYIVILIMISTGFILYLKQDNLSEKKINDLGESDLKIKKKILVKKVLLQEKNEIFEYSGFLEPNKIVNISGKIDGFIKEIFINQGERVVKDQILLKIDDDDKKADFEKAKKLLIQRNNELENNQKLFKQNIISKTKLDESFTLQKDAISLFEKAKKNLDLTNITSPIDGYIDKIPFKVGDYIKGSMSNVQITKVFSDEDFIITVFIPQNNIFSIKQNQYVKFFMDFGDREKIISKTGQIKFISNIADNFTRTYLTEIFFDNKKNYDPSIIKVIGSAVNVKIEGDKTLAISLKDSMIFLDDIGNLVAKCLDNKNKVKFLRLKPMGSLELKNSSSWFSVDENDIKNLEILDSEKNIAFIARGGGFVQENEEISNSEIYYD